MSDSTFDLHAAHKWFGVSWNNSTWGLLDKPDRSPNQDLDLIHSAHASCRHWLEVGNTAQQQRAECLVANAHAALGDGHAALRHASRCDILYESDPDAMTDWDHAFVLDALARAHAAAGQSSRAAELKRAAHKAGEAIADPEDRKIFVNWFESGNWHGV